MEPPRVYPTLRLPLGGIAWLGASVGLVWVSAIAVGWSFGQPLPWIGWLGAVSALVAAFHVCAVILRRPRIELDRTQLRIVTAHATRVIALRRIDRIRRATLSGAQVRHGALGADVQTPTADLLEIVHDEGRIMLRADQFRHLTDFDSFLDTLEARTGHRATSISE